MKERGLRLKTIRKSHNQKKKWDAVFQRKDDSTFATAFGARGMSDYTKHKDKTRRARYINRHSGMPENWKDPTTPGALSRFVLWEKPNFKEAVAAYKKRFNL